MKMSAKGKKTVYVKGHERRLPTGEKIWVSRHTRKIETDKPYDEWFAPRRETGWEKSHPKDERRKNVLEATDKRLSLRKRYVQAGRMMQSLANVTQDEETERKAKSDADYFFNMAKKQPKNG